MKRLARDAVLTIVLAGLTTASVPYATTARAQARRIDAKDADTHVGEQVQICAPVVTYSCDSRTGLLTLDLDTPTTSRGVGADIVFSNWPKFGGDALLDKYLHAFVCASGVLGDDRGGRFRLSIERSGQLEIVAPAAHQEVFGPDAVLACHEGVTSPTVISNPRPSYTREAMNQRQQGRVVLDAVVEPDGRVRRARVVLGLRPDYGLDDEAVKTVKHWRFRPGTLDGRPVPVVVIVELLFTLR
jgi:TonB family protein